MNMKKVFRCYPDGFIKLECIKCKKYKYENL